jgi:hypothetical protein
MTDPEERIPADVIARRNAVRLGVRDALAQEVDFTSRRTASRIAASGGLGLATAIGAIALFARGGLKTADPLMLAVCAAAWASLVGVLFTLAMLRIGTPRLPLAESAVLALMGLALAAVLGVVCPHPQMLMWWMKTSFGRWAASTLGLEASSLCMGLCLALVAGAGSAILVSVRAAGRTSVLIPAFLLFLVIWPSVIVQSMGESGMTLASWSIGLAIGACVGVAAGTLARRVLVRALPANA